MIKYKFYAKFMYYHLADKLAIAREIQRLVLQQARHPGSQLMW